MTNEVHHRREAGHAYTPPPSEAVIVIQDDPAPDPGLFEKDKLRNLAILPGVLFVNEDRT